MENERPAILPEEIVSELCKIGEDTPELEKMVRKARTASDFLKALSHETRLLLLCYIAERERSVTELEGILSLRQPTVSQQLARLRLDGLVRTRRDGKTIYYSIADEKLHRVIEVIYDIFCRGDGIGRSRR
jgi:DNA-binding transcriptional ArsR family regulator